MSKKKGGKKHKKKGNASGSKAPVRIVEITVPDNGTAAAEPPHKAPAKEASAHAETAVQDASLKSVQPQTAVQEPSPKKSSAGKVFLKIAAAVIACALFIGGGLLFLRFQPLSKAYSLIISSPAFTFRVGDEDLISYYFKQETDVPLLLRLQKDKKENVRFQSSDASVVAVDDTGRLSAVGSGRAIVTVSVEDLSENIQVTSYPRGRYLIFDKQEYVLNSGEETGFSVSVVPAEALVREEIRVSVSDESILEITEDRQIRALSPGEAEVIAEVEGLLVRSRVTVYEPMTGIAFSSHQDSRTLHVERGGRLSFPVHFFPENTTDPKDVTYSVSDPAVGTILENGLFLAKELGTVTVTAECNGFTDSILVEVEATLLGIQLNRTETTLIYPKQDQLVTELIPEDTTDEISLHYASSNPGAVTVDETGLVRAVGPGTAVVTAYVNDYEASCIYHVHVPVTGVTISTGRLTLNKGQTAKLSASVYPSFATEDHSITWRSDNPNIVSVDASGNIRAVNGGSTRIYAIHGNVSNSCLVSVYVPIPRSEIANRIISYGKQFLGTRYVYGGESLTGGIDCSSLVQKCFATQGIRLPRNSAAQSTCGTRLPMDPSQWLPGDLLFYSPKGYVSHVAIYIGNGQILQASQSMGCVCITSYVYNGFSPSAARRVF